jgi:hypothetical protein
MAAQVLYPTNYISNAPRMIASIAYDPPRVCNLSNVNNGSAIDAYRMVLAENQKVLQCLLLFNNI